MAVKSSSSKIQLIPWDFDSTEHSERMYMQRVTCGWRHDEVESWKVRSAEGTKALYWITLSDDLTGKDDLLAQHVTKYPKESSPLLDTATKSWKLPLSPSGRPFMPVGHLALELKPEEDERLLKLSPDSPLRVVVENGAAAGAGTAGVWICHLYISWALQSSGLGKHAMAEAERAMVEPPLDAQMAFIDTLPTEFQMDPEWLQEAYLDHDNPVPKISNQVWYERQGYVPFFWEKGAYDHLSPHTGKRKLLDVVYFSKRIRT